VVAAFGFLNGPVGIGERVLAAIAAAMLIFPNIATDVIGTVLVVVFARGRILAGQRRSIQQEVKPQGIVREARRLSE
jgi:UPF0716 family protein affecting phage T7 exclusion